jgi:hypothetical protein
LSLTAVPPAGPAVPVAVAAVAPAVDHSAHVSDFFNFQEAVRSVFSVLLFILVSFIIPSFIALLINIQDQEEEVIDNVSAPVTSRYLLKELKHWQDIPEINFQKHCSLSWWKANCSRFPFVAKLAKKYLAIQSSSAPSERVFSNVKMTISKKRWQLLPENIEAHVLLSCNSQWW